MEKVFNLLKLAKIVELKHKITLWAILYRNKYLKIYFASMNNGYKVSSWIVVKLFKYSFGSEDPAVDFKPSNKVFSISAR